MEGSATVTSASSWAKDEIPISPPFDHVDGCCWRSCLPSEVSFRGDTNEHPYISRVMLLENGKPIGTPHSVHARIVREGAGLFSCWHNRLYFSTSDNSDPNTNGRRYGVTLAPFETGIDPVRILSLGSCQVHDPVSDLHNRGLATAVMAGTTLQTNSHYFAEHCQLIQYCRGNVCIPREIREHIFGNPDFDPRNDNGGFVDSADVVLMEVCTQFEFLFEGYHINRNIILTTIVDRARNWGEGAYVAACDWFWNGLLKTDEEARKGLAAKLIAFMPAGNAQAEVDRALVAEAHAVKLDTAAMRRRLEEARETVTAPLAVVTHILRYMPDGRPIVWPPEYLQVINDACRAVDVAIINPCRLVMDHGVESGMTKDMGHYERAFIRVVAEEFLPFIDNVMRRQRISRAKFPIPLTVY